jgi:CheY-like chemotaxis protein
VALAKKLKLPYQCAVNGREAFELYRDSPSGFFLILMDLSMPVMDGHTSTAKIRQLEKELHLPRTTIVALTGVTNDESKKRAFESGVDGYYTKPIHMKDIKKLVETAQRPPS